MPDGNHNITFTSCNAGTRTDEAKEDSVIDKVKSQIAGRWPDSTAMVRGACGPSVKTFSVEGEEYWGVRGNDKKELGGKVQSLLNEVYGIDIRKSPEFKDDQDLETRATNVQVNQRQYFLDLINIVNGNLEAVSENAMEKLNADADLRAEVEGGYSVENPIREVNVAAEQALVAHEEKDLLEVKGEQQETQQVEQQEDKGEVKEDGNISKG